MTILFQRGKNFDSTIGVPVAVKWLALIVILYIVLRVCWQLWYDKKHGVENPLLPKKSRSRGKTPSSKNNMPN